MIALSQEDKSLEDHARMRASLGQDLPFAIVADLERQETLGYDRTTATFIDKQGVVRQVFPMIIHARPSWRVILREIDRLTGS